MNDEKASGRGAPGTGGAGSGGGGLEATPQPASSESPFGGQIIYRSDDPPSCGAEGGDPDGSGDNEVSRDE